MTEDVVSPDDPGPPLITGYRTGEALKEGERRVLSCLVVGGNPPPWVTWYRHGRPLNPSSSVLQPPALSQQMLQPPALSQQMFQLPALNSQMLKPLSLASIHMNTPSPSIYLSSSSSPIPQRLTSKEEGVRVDQQVRATREEDRAVYECQVASPLLTSPLTTNVTLTVHCKYSRLTRSATNT